MTDVKRILSQIEHGDPNAAQQLLPLIDDELRKLAAEIKPERATHNCGIGIGKFAFTNQHVQSGFYHRTLVDSHKRLAVFFCFVDQNPRRDRGYTVESVWQ